MSYIQYQSVRKKNPTAEEIMHDMKAIAKANGVYIKDADVFSDYFWDCIQRVKQQNYYYYCNRLQVLAYRHERAKRAAKKHGLKAA